MQTIVSQLSKLDWDFKKADTNYSTHGFHTYPAMMIPQIARRLIELYGLNAKTIIDPFVGSGTTMVEATLHNNFEMAYGLDINPLALLLAKVKTTKLDFAELENEHINLSDRIKNFKSEKATFPHFQNIGFWFNPSVVKELAIIKNSIDAITENKFKDFFLVAFSETVRTVSNTRNGEFKLYRIPQKELENFNPNVLNEFEKNVSYNIAKMKEYFLERKKCAVNLLDEDTRKIKSIPRNSVDLLISSPPYGDSRTTVAYGQFSRLALQWLGYDSERVKSIDKTSIGGIPTKELKNGLHSPSLKKTLPNISSIDPKRAKDVLSFYEDFWQCVKEIDKIMASGSRLCFVVGNRTVKKIQIPTDRIIVELFESLGNYSNESNFERNIPNKRMPKANSPSNVPGEIVSTMNKEHIVILRKD